MPGTREIRKDEPPKEMAHEDFLIKEMQDMAQDFREETYSKRYILAKLAYEAQAKALEWIKAKAADDKGAPVQVISGPGGEREDAQEEDELNNMNDMNDNMKTAKPFDRSNDEDDLLAGPRARP